MAKDKKDKKEKKDKKKDKGEKKDKKNKDKKSKKKDNDSDEKKDKKKKKKDKGEKKSKGDKKDKSEKKDKKKKKKKDKEIKSYTIDDISAQADVDERDVKAFFDTLRRRLERMAVGSKVKFPKFCILEKVATNPRKARNPRTGESVDVPAKEKIAFRVSPNLKNL